MPAGPGMPQWRRRLAGPAMKRLETRCQGLALDLQASNRMLASVTEGCSTRDLRLNRPLPVRPPSSAPLVDPLRESIYWRFGFARGGNRR